MSRVQTPRLAGEPIDASHTAALETMLGDPRVGATMGGVLDADGVRSSVAAKVAHWEHHGFGYWVWRERASGDVVARGGLQHTWLEGAGHEVEVGWVVSPERWGEGFATELGAASVRFGFERLGLADVIAFALPENAASRRVMEKLGFAYEREAHHAGLPHVVYRVRRPAQPA